MQKFDHVYRINQVLSTIHSDITANLDAKTLAKQAAYSEHYFHRQFKKVTGEAVHQYVRRTRLEAAANQLMFAPNLTVQNICEACGFQSLSSFSRAFKSVYLTTPGEWRTSKQYESTNHYLSDLEISAAYKRIENKALPTPDIVHLEPRQIAYIRHTGYGRSIHKLWRTIRAWAVSEQRSAKIQIGLYHSNPALVPLHKCRYVACLEIDKPVMRRGQISSAIIPGGLHAAFTLNGRYGELLPYISKIFEQWLPGSTYLPKTTPAFAVYQKNQFLNKDDLFELVFYLPINFNG